MRVVDDAVEDRVGQRRVADDLVPVVDRHLAGDDQRAGAVAILDDLQQIALLFGKQRFRTPIVDGCSEGAGDIVRMVGGFRSEWWARSDQNPGRLQIGIGGRLTSEFASGDHARTAYCRDDSYDNSEWPAS